LEVKNNSILNKEKYQIDENKIDRHLEMIITNMAKNGYQRYEVSSWASHLKYESVHNKSY
jgi:coproporphyrinogen III oxidase-like Fe-S oxidoreductase